MRVLVDNDSRWSLQILLNEDITVAASAIRRLMSTEHCQDTWSCRRIPHGERLQIHQRVADQYRGFGPLSLAKRYAYQRRRRHSRRMTDFLLPTGMMSRIRWYRQPVEWSTKNVWLWKNRVKNCTTVPLRTAAELEQWVNVNKCRLADCKVDVKLKLVSHSNY